MLYLERLFSDHIVYCPSFYGYHCIAMLVDAMLLADNNGFMR